jgi:hypothetical protein
MEQGADILLRLSAQRALLGAVTPNLRSFSVEMIGGTVTCQAVFEDAPAADEIDLIQSSSTEIIADFVDAEIEERFIVCVDQAMPKALTYLIYQRHEPQD